MTAEIRDLLQRRTDLSTYLAHFTKDRDDATGRQSLVSIMRENCLRAQTAYGMGASLSADEQFLATQRVVCFTETPLEHAWMITAEITGRQRMGPYGLAITKVWGRRNQVNPIWYIDITPGHNWLTKPINNLAQTALAESLSGGKPLAEADISQILPFIEQMGPTLDSMKEFWWEREWRHVGHLMFDWSEVVVVFAPEFDHQTLHDELSGQLGPDSNWRVPPIVDPNWGLERMIASLRQLPSTSIGPFT